MSYWIKEKIMHERRESFDWMNKRFPFISIALNRISQIWKRPASNLFDKNVILVICSFDSIMNWILRHLCGERSEFGCFSTQSILSFDAWIFGCQFHSMMKNDAFLSLLWDVYPTYTTCCIVQTKPLLNKCSHWPYFFAHSNQVSSQSIHLRVSL